MQDFLGGKETKLWNNSSNWYLLNELNISLKNRKI